MECETMSKGVKIFKISKLQSSPSAYHYSDRGCSLKLLLLLLLLVLSLIITPTHHQSCFHHGHTLPLCVGKVRMG